MKHRFTVEEYATTKTKSGYEFTTYIVVDNDVGDDNHPAVLIQLSKDTAELIAKTLNSEWECIGRIR